MKKTATAADQPGKTDATPEIQVRQTSSHKMHRNHKVLHHSHGRVNSPIGINFAPGIF